MGDVVFEILTEEIPARFAENAREQLRTVATKKLADLGLTFQTLNTFITPRRLTLHIEGLDDEIAAQTVHVRGPRTSGPPQALEGFLTKTGTSQADLIQEDTPKGSFWVAPMHTPAQCTENILPSFLQDLVYHFTWPATMFWGEARRAFVRPIRRVLALWNNQPMAFTLDFDDTSLTANNLTEGHRFKGRGPFSVTSWSAYKDILAQNGVMLCDQERRQSILDQAEALLTPHKLSLSLKDRDTGGLLDEVTHLVECPAAYMGALDPDLMDLPGAVIAVTIRHHQRCFPTYHASGALQPFFLATANGALDDGGKTFVRGVERVVRARLRDALFLYQEDQKKRLKDHAEALKTRTFFNHLGTLADKARRLEALAQETELSTPELVEAARLAKADLATQMVQEFPELQGIMGAHYGSTEGLSASITQAIAGHYPGAHMPNPEGLVLGILDSIDSLCGFFALGQKPTGSKDPLGLKRMGNDILIRLSKLDKPLDIEALLIHAKALYSRQGIAFSNPNIMDQLRHFFDERLAFFFKNQGISTNTCQFLGGAYLYEPFDLQKRIAYGLWTSDHIQDSSIDNVSQALKRAINIIGKCTEEETGSPVDPALFEDPSESKLWNALEAFKTSITRHKDDLDFDKIWSQLDTLAGSIDNFFEAVMVNSEDISLKKNRIGLLEELVRTTNIFGTWSKL